MTTFNNIIDKYGNEHSMRYGITYAPEALSGPGELTFPLYFSRTDAETMLYALQWLARKHKVVDQLVWQAIPPAAYLYTDANSADGSFPLLPFLIGLAGKENVHTITWGDPNLEISNLPDGMEVKDHPVRFFFPVEHFFHQLFFEAIGAYDHDPGAMFGYLYLHEWMEGADYDLFEILELYKTIFIKEDVMPTLLRKLHLLFSKIEDLLGERLFVYKIGPAPKPRLAEVIGQGFDRIDNIRFPSGIGPCDQI